MSSWRKSAPVCKRNGNALSPSGRPGANSNVAIGGICLSGFMNNSNPELSLRLCLNFSRLERTQPKSANIEARDLWLTGELFGMFIVGFEALSKGAPVLVDQNQKGI